MIKLGMDCLHLYSSELHKGLCFLVGFLNGVSGVCVLQPFNLLFLAQTVFTIFSPSYFDNDVFYVHEIVLTYF